MTSTPRCPALPGPALCLLPSTLEASPTPRTQGHLHRKLGFILSFFHRGGWETKKARVALRFAADTWGHCCSVSMPTAGDCYKQEVGGGQISQFQLANRTLAGACLPSAWGWPHSLEPQSPSVAIYDHLPPGPGAKPFRGVTFCYPHRDL